MTRAIWLWLLIVCIVGQAQAEWLPGDQPLDPSAHAWFLQQKNKLNQICCDEGDGAPVSAWGTDDKGYWVEIYGKHFQVPPDAIDPAPNEFGAALVWTYPLGSHDPQGVRCFLSGTMG